MENGNNQVSLCNDQCIGHIKEINIVTFMNTMQ